LTRQFSASLGMDLLYSGSCLGKESHMARETRNGVNRSDDHQWWGSLRSTHPTPLEPVGVWQDVGT
jgi:hypothetical protein